MFGRAVCRASVVAALLASAVLAAEDSRPLSMIVLDPLAAPLSCPCVEGYAQRDYEVLARHLHDHLQCEVKVTFAESLESALKMADGRADLIVGKQSVVMADADASKLEVVPLAQLTNQHGSTTQHGLIVVHAMDPASEVRDLTGYNIIFGPAQSEEKHAAAKRLLELAGVTIARKQILAQACSDGASKVVELGPQSKTAAVISSYAQPLLEGCGTIRKGDLRVVARTRDVPFITAFASKTLPASSRKSLELALLAASTETHVLEALESLFGFLPVPNEPGSRAAGTATNREKNVSSSGTWPGWRGPNRDGRVPHLPSSLTPEPNIAWEISLDRPGLGGIAATTECVIFGDRDLDDFHDVYRCLDAKTGRDRWQVKRLAIGSLDYGNSPRATPLIANGRVYCLGAHGTLLCVEVESGEVIWELNLREKFGSPGELPWGWCGSPLLVNDRLIVSPGTADASLVALDAATGSIVWTCSGNKPAYGSFNIIDVNGRQQIVGYDSKSLGGWNPKSGKRIWSVRPPIDGDFNVPTPLFHNGQLLVATENNGTRSYRFRNDDRIDFQTESGQPKAATRHEYRRDRQ